MDKISAYRAILRTLPDWEPYLHVESRLPGPRSNLELVYAVAEEAGADMAEHLLSYSPDKAPENTPEVFLAVCGTVALGRLLAEGHTQYLARLRALANDPRWRVREGVAMALQRLGDADIDRLVEIVLDWGSGILLEQRAAAAAICEPRLLKEPRAARAALDLLDNITLKLCAVENRKTDEFQSLRKGLGYCWSVAVAALPAEGKGRFEAWVSSGDPDIHWIMRENLKKNRLLKIDPAWVERLTQALQH